MASNRKSNESKKPTVKNLAPRDETKVKAGRKAGGTQQEYLTPRKQGSPGQLE